MAADQRREDGPAPDESPAIHLESTGSVGNLVQTTSVTGGVHFHSAQGPRGDKPKVPKPCQLPPAPRSFVGRDHDLAVLTDSLGTTVGPGGTVLISALAGTGGIGKTWLALHWAHTHRNQFPDGQLFVDLRGYSAEGNPVDPLTALAGFLDAFDVDPAGVAGGLEGLVALFRSVVVDKRILIVLDNAASVDQVTPLLPGGDNCTVIVTSRNTLTGLISRHGAHHLELAKLNIDETQTLLTQRLGAERVAAEPAAVAELSELCGGFPMALAIVAGRALVHPQIPLAEFTAELRDDGLEALADDDPKNSLPAVLSWSYRTLNADQRRAFGLLGIAPGPDIGLWAAASLTGLSLSQAGRVLRQLTEASLLSRGKGDRYFMHDLVRRYAVDTAQRDLEKECREEALRRVVDYYLHTAHAADRFLTAHHPFVHVDPPVVGCQPHPLPGNRRPMAWFATEHSCLLAACQVAAAQGWHDAVWHLARALDAFHRREGHRLDRLCIWQAALAASRHLPIPTAAMIAHQSLGHAYADLHRDEKAIMHLSITLGQAEDQPDAAVRAAVHCALAAIHRRRGSTELATQHSGRAAVFFRKTKTFRDDARARVVGGDVGPQCGNCGQVHGHGRAAVIPDGFSCTTPPTATDPEHMRYITNQQVVHFYQQAFVLYWQLEDTGQVADTLEQLGQTYAELGQQEQAREVWREALNLYDVLKRPEDLQRVQRRLGRGAATSTPTG